MQLSSTVRSDNECISVFYCAVPLPFLCSSPSAKLLKRASKVKLKTKTLPQDASTVANSTTNCSSLTTISSSHRECQSKGHNNHATMSTLQTGSLKSQSKVCISTNSEADRLLALCRCKGADNCNKDMVSDASCSGGSNNCTHTDSSTCKCNTCSQCLLGEAACASFPDSPPRLSTHARSKHTRSLYPKSLSSTSNGTCAVVRTVQRIPHGHLAERQSVIVDSKPVT